MKALMRLMASFLILLGKLNLFVSFRLFQSCLTDKDGVCVLHSACLLLGEPMLENRKLPQTSWQLGLSKEDRWSGKLDRKRVLAWCS